MKEFLEYCWSFYGPNEIYGDFFNNTLTKEELKNAIQERMKLKTPFDGDSLDREMVRDIILNKRGAKELEMGHLIGQKSKHRAWAKSHKALLKKLPNKD